MAKVVVIAIFLFIIIMSLFEVCLKYLAHKDDVAVIEKKKNKLAEK